MSNDDRLEELRRAAEQSPEDDEAGALYEAALVRAGAGQALKERYRFDFLCPLKWEDLAETAEADRRYCDRCEKSVTWVATESELRRCAGAGECVAVRVSEVEGRLEFLVSVAEETGRVIKPSCMVAGEAAPSEGTIAMGGLSPTWVEAYRQLTQPPRGSEDSR